MHTDDEYLIRAALDDAAEHARWHHARSQVTWHTDGDGHWRTRLIWADHETFDTTHHDHATARRDGMQKACLAGSRTITVIAPDGTVTDHWERHHNLWITNPTRPT